MDFDDLNAAERALWDAFPSGRAVHLEGRTEDPPIARDGGPGGSAAGPGGSAGGPGVSAGGPGGPGVSAGGGPGGAVTGALGGAVPGGPGGPMGGGPGGTPGTLGGENAIRAEVLLALLTGARQREPGQVAGVQLSGARITGSLNLGNAAVNVPFSLTNCVFDEPLYLHWARLKGVQLLDCALPSLVASGARIDGHLWLEGCRISGGLLLDGAHITGLLFLSGAHLSNPAGEAMLGDRMTVEGNVYCGIRDKVEGGQRRRIPFTADGEVRLPRANIAGQLIMRGAMLRNAGKIALYASLVQVGANAFFDGGFTAQGEIRLRGARIGGYLSLVGADLTNPGRATLNAADLKIDTDVYCNGDFTSVGKASFDGAEIGGELTFHTAYLSFNRPRPDTPHETPNITDPALSLQRLEAEEVDLRTAGRIDGVLELQYAKIGVLRDERETWPNRMQLDGLRYENLSPPLTAKDRLNWIRRDTDGYAPQPYDRLAQTYTLLGLDKETREVLLAKQRDRHATSLSAAVKVWGWIQDITVGYGYKPLRALAWLVAIQIAGTVIFTIYRPPYLNVQDMGHNPKNFPTYDPFLFTLNQLLPVGNFNQQNLFAPHGIYLWIADVISALGLILGLTVFAGVARVLSRE
jgi:hypothetical protein